MRQRFLCCLCFFADCERKIWGILVGIKYDTCLYNICEENDSEKRILFDVLAEHELIED